MSSRAGEHSEKTDEEGVDAQAYTIRVPRP